MDLLMVKTEIIKLILIVGIGAGIGWITNYVAIKMLFKPYKEINFLFFRIQGLIPKRKKEIGENIAEIIQKEIVSLKDIVLSLNKDDIEKKMEIIIDTILEEKLEKEIHSKFPMLAMFLSEDILLKIKIIIKMSILENRDDIIKMFTDYMEENIDFKGIIVTNIDNFSLEKLEEITYSVATKEFKHIEIIGAILGAIIGVLQYFIGLVF